MLNDARVQGRKISGVIVWVGVIVTSLVLWWWCMLHSTTEEEVQTVQEQYFTRQTHANYKLLKDSDELTMRGYENDGVDCIIIKSKRNKRIYSSSISLDCNRDK